MFLALNFRAAVNRRYAKQDGPDLIVDIFDMGSSSDAYGAYHHDMREGESAAIGRESEHGGSSLFFWKDRYYVSVVAMADNQKSHASVSAVARAIADKIEGDGDPPAILGWLPEDGLQGDQLHYFHTWPLLNRHYHFANEDLLELGRDTEGVIARYRGPGGNSAIALFLIRYPSPERAQRARARFAKGFLSGASDGVVETPKGWAGLGQRGELLVGVFEAKSKERVEALLSAVERRRKGEK